MTVAAKTANRQSAARTVTESVEIPTLSFTDAAAWSTWLEAHHASSRGIWLKIAKKGSKARSVSYAQALDVALTWGWIDGQKGKLDDAWWLQRFTPRGARSIWSKINREKVDVLMRAGKMMPAGIAEVDRAKRDGRWEAAYDSQSKSTVPEDLAEALAKSPRAAAFFKTLESNNRYAILFRVHTAKKSETRAARIARFIAMLERHEKVHP